MQEQQQRLLVFVVLAAGVAATVASSPAPAGDITGSAGPVSVTLDVDTPSVEKSVDASLTASAPIETGSASVRLSADFSDGAAQVRLGIASASDSAETDVLDTSAQPSVSIAVEAFSDCSDTPCSDTLTLTFERLEADVVDPVTFDFSLDGAASVADDGSGTAGDGSLDLTVN